MPTLAQSYLTTQFTYFKYRRPITINNTQNTNTLKDYQVLVVIDTASLISAGKMRSDCGDIRFTDTDGVTQLSYWIEPNTINTSSTRIWVRVPNIPASSTKTIYMYYGNPSVSSASNGDGTFLLFDNFDALDNSKWVFDSPKVSVSNSILSIRGAGGCDIVFVSKVGFTYTKGIIGISVMWRSRYYSEYANSGFDLFIPHQNVAVDDCGGTSGSWYLFANFVNKIWQHSGTTYTNVATGSGADTSGAWHIYHAIYDQNFNIKILQDTTTLVSYTNTSWTTLYGFLAYREGNHDIDWVAVRYYSAPEPSSSVGSEYTMRLPDTM
jgi:hypothetical protein